MSNSWDGWYEGDSEGRSWQLNGDAPVVTTCDVARVRVCELAKTCAEFRLRSAHIAAVKHT